MVASGAEHVVLGAGPVGRSLVAALVERGVAPDLIPVFVIDSHAVADELGVRATPVLDALATTVAALGASVR